MAGKESPRGPTSDAVRSNIEAVRKAQNLNYTQVSELLARGGWTISAVGVRRIESGERRVDVDDLMAIAAALGVSPSSLLMPDLTTVTPTDLVPITGTQDPISAITAWKWITADMPFIKGIWGAFVDRALPPWEREERITPIMFPSESRADGNDK